MAVRVLSHFRSAGFTMIELLVVIAVIGVLAVAVLSSINPIEQINKGRDTRTRSDAAQLINAVDRYFSIHEEYPWNTANPSASPAYDPVTAGTSIDYQDEFIFDETGTLVGGISTWSWTDILTDTAEIKAGFVNRLKTDVNTEYLLYKAGSPNATMFICFAPSSNAFRQEAQTRCAEGGVDADVSDVACPAVGCVDGTDLSTCMACIP